MKTVVIYKSRYGYTEKYAKWLSEKLNADLFEAAEIRSLDFSEYDTVIYGGGLYAGGINGLKNLKEIFGEISEKNIVLFTVGLADPLVESNTEGIRLHIDRDFSQEMKERIKVFHLRGGIDYSKLGLIHKSMMMMLKKSVEKKPENDRTQEDSEMLETYGEQVDFTDIGSLEPLVSYLKKLEAE